MDIYLPFAVPVEVYMLKGEWTRWSIYFSFAQTISIAMKKI